MKSLTLRNGLFNEVDAEIKFSKNRRPIFDGGSGSTQSKIPARSRRPSDPIPELTVNNFKQNDLNESEFKLIISMNRIPEEEGIKGVKIVPGIAKIISIKSNKVEINPHHIEVLDKTNDPAYNKFIVIIHYMMKIVNTSDEKFQDMDMGMDMDMDRDPKIIHPDEQ